MYMGEKRVHRQPKEDIGKPKVAIKKTTMLWHGKYKFTCNKVFLTYRCLRE
ncbi:hypothetical protein GCM10009114_08580 [Aliiglaciecola litoralis]|uniref:Integrase n=1 Tax=Aliiglaciecola litoralis TaxID=582857 RepID=A0ABN1LDX8_9ALTE